MLHAVETMKRRASVTRALLFSCALAPAPAIVSCAKQSPEHTVLQGDDLQEAEAPFDPNAIVDLPAFVDTQGIDASQVQAFLERTPYGRRSFLGTYQSNGVRVADAMLRTAARYKINPLVFLVRAQMDQGLVGEEFYPAPASRVEYAFGCGCAGAGSCDPRLAGFDNQIDCLGRALRTSLDEIAQTGLTAGQWGPGQTSVTLDNQSITPADASTAALYQYTPVVALKKGGGNWLFWNLWQKYALELSYFGSFDNGSGAGAYIGDPCKGEASCPYPGGTCVANYPGGLCTASCTAECPPSVSGGSAFCADFPGQGGFCLAVCNSDAPVCRAGYSCKRVARFGASGTTESVCSPD
jgi:hypothetical protein